MNTISNINKIKMINKKHIKMKKTSSSYEKGVGNKSTIKYNNRQINSKKIQRILSKKLNKQIGQNRKINKEVYGGKEIMVNERKTENIVRKSLEKNFKTYNKVKIEEQQSDNPRINKLLKNASKKGNGCGKPEFIISFDEVKDLVIVIECKADIRKHSSKLKDKYADFSVDGALLYSSFLSKEFNVISIAVSGQTEKELLVSNYLQLTNESSQILDANKILSFEDYIKILKTDEKREKIEYSKLMNFSRYLNKYLRDKIKIGESNRALLVSGILIALSDNSFKISYPKELNSKDLAHSLLNTIIKILKNADIPESKRDSMIQTYEFIKVLAIVKEKKENKLYNLIEQIESNIHFFLEDYKYNHDVLGQFYGEFLRYANGDKSLGIVLTPKHITELFAELVDLKKDNIVYDNCCGTGGFLISSMGKMFKDAKGDSSEEEKIKKERLIGVENDPKMFSLGSSNMLLRGDGKANVYYGNCFDYTKIIKDKHKPNVGFLNPPYSQESPEESEFKFIEQNLECLEKNSYCVSIVPMGCALSQELMKKQILGKHSLLSVMSMPDELFYPIGTVTCIMIFKAHVPHDYEKDVWFGLWKDDGFIKAKNEGRIDKNGSWKNIKKEWLKMYKNLNIIPSKSVKHKIEWNSEWCAEEYIDTDYSELDESNFKKIILDYISHCIFKEDLNAVKKFCTEKKIKKLEIKKWGTFKLSKIFNIKLGKPIHKNTIKEYEIMYNKSFIPYVTRTTKNNGVELFIDKNMFEEKIISGNAITIGAEGFKAYYQKKDFFTGNKVNILYSNKLNEFSALFINTILNLEIKNKFNYGRGLVKSRLERMKIKLPIDEEKNPDWEFMENYIKSIKFEN